MPGVSMGTRIMVRPLGPIDPGTLRVNKKQ